MACLEEAAGSRQHHTHPIAAKVTRVEPGRKYLAVHARQLALEPGLQILRRHPRSLLLRLEQAHRYALEDNVHRNKRMGGVVTLWILLVDSAGRSQPASSNINALGRASPSQIGPKVV